jgi:hypothetical protein
MSSSWTLAGAGPALAPPQVAGPLVILTQQHTDGPGVGLWGVDPKSGSVKWRTVLGSPWPTLPVSEDGGGGLAALGLNGEPLAIGGGSRREGGFVLAGFPRPGGLRFSSADGVRVDGQGWTVVVPQLGSAKALVRAGSGDLRETSLPAPVGATPLAWGGELLVPGDDGRAYLVDPITGESRSEPFVPPFDRVRLTRWRAPARVDPDEIVLADDAGRVRRISRVNDPRPRLTAAAETTLDRAIISGPVATTNGVVLVTDDRRVRALSSRDLSPVGAWALEAPLACPPSVSGEYAFVADVSGHVIAFAGDGQRLWSARLEGAGDQVVAAGQPVVIADEVYVLARDGTLHRRSVRDGTPLGRTPLGVCPVGGPIPLKDTLLIPAGHGTVCPVTIGAGATGAASR